MWPFRRQLTLKETGDGTDDEPVGRRLADKRLERALACRTERYRDRGLVDMFSLLERTETRLRRLRESATEDSRTFDGCLADLDEIRNEIEARGICPYHQAALTVCCLS